MNQREDLIKMLEQAEEKAEEYIRQNDRMDHIPTLKELLGVYADCLIENGVIVPPCKVGDTVYYINTQYHMALYRNKIYEAKVARIVVTSLGVCLVIHIKDESGCCEVPDVRDFGKTVFLTKEEAEKALAETTDKRLQE